MDRVVYCYYRQAGEVAARCGRGSWPGCGTGFCLRATDLACFHQPRVVCSQRGLLADILLSYLIIYICTYLGSDSVYGFL
jgi:hypothetical protein